MDWDLVLVGLRILLSSCTAYLLFYASAAIARPEYFLRAVWVDRDQYDSGWLPKAQIVVLFVGGGTAGWFASQGLTLAIPSEWGFVTEDGDWQSWREYFAGIIGFVCGAGACAIRPEDPDVALSKHRILDEARDMLISRARYGSDGAGIRERVALAADRSKRQLRGGDYESRYWAHLLSEIDRK